jgi:lipopolysaccharide export system permease protein
MILRMLPGPILGWLGTLMFLLLMQFLIKYLPDIAGKGLPISVIVELVAYNLAYMVVLAVPMSVLIGTLMVFGRVSESRAYVVVKSSGVSPMQLIWPTLLVGIFLTAGMTYFNNIVLPEANFRARNLWFDIR